MGLSFSVGGVSFGELLGSAAGRYAIDITRAAPERAVRAYHPPGVDGNYLVDGGRTGRKITVDVLYIGTPSQLDTWTEADIAAWSGSLVAVDGTERCLLTPGGGQPTDRPRAVGDGTNVFQYWTFVFDQM